MPSDELTIPLKIEAIEKESRAFQCPNCDVHLQFLVRVQVAGVHQTDRSREFLAAKAKAHEATQVQSKPEPRRVELVEQAKRDGVFAAFAKTVQVSTPHNIPSDLERFFITFLTRATKIQSPQFAIRMCLPEDEQDGKLELWAFMNIAGVVKDGYLKTFIPYQLVNGKDMPDTLVPDSVGVGVKRAEMTLPVWVKTRNGYVSFKGMLFNELRGKAAGQFANTGL